MYCHVHMHMHMHAGRHAGRITKQGKFSSSFDIDIDIDWYIYIYITYIYIYIYVIYIYIYYIYIYIYIRYPTSQNLEKYCFWLLALFYVSCFLSFLFDFRCVCWLSGRVAGLRVILHQIVATLLTTVYSCNNPLIFVSFGLSLLS